MKNEEYITLKWGTLKSWNLINEEALSLMDQYIKIGCSAGCAMQEDTKEQKEIICKLIDLMPGKIFLDWDGKYVSKNKAKKYVMEFSCSEDLSVNFESASLVSSYKESNEIISLWVVSVGGYSSRVKENISLVFEKAKKTFPNIKNMYCFGYYLVIVQENIEK